jgi:hypothetical protein
LSERVEAECKTIKIKKIEMESKSWLGERWSKQKSVKSSCEKEQNVIIRW